ncbi:9707_t:CDS:1, partial [Cetraspora pellucida]
NFEIFQMEMLTEMPTCSGCGNIKLISEFERLDVKGKLKQFCTCNDCHTKLVECKNAKKRQLETEEHDQEIEENQENVDYFEIIDLNDLSRHFLQLQSTYSAQPDNNLDSATPFHFQCGIDISTFDKSSKEIAEELVELIEDIDEFAW